jgi:hypothetical protein
MLCLTARLGAAVLGLSLAAGCGLISSDVTNFDLTLQPKKFSIDASGWQVNTADPNLFTNGQLKSMQCSSSAVCNSAAEGVCSTDCSGSCNPATSFCDLSLDVSRPLPVNLLTEQPELMTINDQPVIKVTIDSVTYEVTSNTLNVDTPDVRVYVAPVSSLQPTDMGAKLIGTIPGISAMTTTTSPQMLMFTSTGKADLVNIMSSFKTPFNVLVGSSLVVSAGQALPTGKLDALVNIKAHAGL